MNVENIVNDVKGRVEPIVAKGQELVQAGFETLKSGGSIVIEGVQSLVQTQVEAGKDLFGLAQESFEKARADGLKAVAQNPIAYVPEGRERVVSAYNDSVAVFSKASDELVKTFKQGYESITAKFNTETAGDEQTVKVKKTGKKPAGKRKTVKVAA